MSLISAFQRQRQADFCEFKISLDYIASSRPARDNLGCFVEKRQNAVIYREKGNNRIGRVK